MTFEHKSVLLDEVIENMNIDPSGIYVDGTIGGGGHSYEIAKRITTGALIGLDQDEAAIRAAELRLAEYEQKVTIIRSNYCEIKNVLNSIQIEKVNGILLDLGVSSYQLDTPQRGFSYREDAPLDMRMDMRNDKTAKDIINDYSEMELYRVIRNYGEDRFAKNIAKHIVMARTDKPIETTFQLNEIIKSAIPARVRAVGGHPSKRTFQALRIELNHELDVLKNTLENMVDLLIPGGRLLIITFHSLEDRIVKNAFRGYENPCTCPPNFPMCVCGKRPKGRMITKKPIIPSEGELGDNKRSKSAKLRAFERQ